ncbi:hypothetical protein HYX18_03415 [Candidatus Woesearchaeota archaeon]|nr:hypothetical protein [Candidatus Woesearchaeota archaeon]
MLTDKEIFKLANDAYNDFLANFLVECQFEVVSLNKFLLILEKNLYLQEIFKESSLKNPKDISLPVLVTSGEKYKLSFCSSILGKILKGFSKEKQRMFISAITLHELYHIVNQVERRELNLFSFLKSNKRAYQEFKEDYKELARILEEAKRRFKKK